MMGVHSYKDTNPVLGALPSLDFPCSSVVTKNLPAMQETQVQSLGQEDTLEKGMATQSIFLPVESHEQRTPGGLQSLGSQSPTCLSDFHFTPFVS